MSQLSKTAYKALYGTAGTKFPDNTTGLITEPIVREQGENQADSFFNITDDAYTASFPQVTASGTNTYTATAAPAITAYATGQKFQIKFTNASSAVSTLNLNSVGAKKIFINPTTQATTGHIVANQISLFAYDATLDAAAGGFLMLGSATDTSGFATTAYVDSLVLGLLDDRGNFDASVNAYPSSGGSGTAGAILKGDVWRISVAGTLPTGLLVEVGDAVRALVDTPGNTQGNWAILEGSVPDADATTKGIAKLYTTPDGTNTDGAVSQAGLNTKFRSTRTVTGTDAIVQGDDNSFIIFNSATPFNFTLDQLTASSKIAFQNIGAGAVTFVNGSGVTLSGEAILPAAIGTEFPSAFIFYASATTPRISNGNANRLSLETVSTASGTITRDFGNKIERMFVGSASISGPKTIADSNDVNALVQNMVLTITNVAAVLTFDTDYTMQTTDSRWNDSAHTFTPAVTGKYEFSAVWDGTDWNLKVTNIYS